MPANYYDPYGIGQPAITSGANAVAAAGRDAGLPPAAIAALVGRAYQENGFTNNLGDAGTSFGMFQVGSGVWNSWLNYARQNNISPSSQYGQTKYLVDYLRNNQPETYKQFVSAKNPTQAFNAWTKWNYGGNRALGRQFAENYFKQQPGGPPPIRLPAEPSTPLLASNSPQIPVNYHTDAPQNWAQGINALSNYNMAQFNPPPALQGGQVITGNTYSAQNPGQLAANTAGTTDYSRPSPDLGSAFRNSPIGRLITQGPRAFVENMPIVRIARTGIHALNGTLGQHGNGARPAVNPSPAAGGAPALQPNQLPTLRFDASGAITNGLPGGTGTIAGVDPRTGRVVYNASPAGDAPPATPPPGSGYASVAGVGDPGNARGNANWQASGAGGFNVTQGWGSNTSGAQFDSRAANALTMWSQGPKGDLSANWSPDYRGPNPDQFDAEGNVIGLGNRPSPWAKYVGQQAAQNPDALLASNTLRILLGSNPGGAAGAGYTTPLAGNNGAASPFPAAFLPALSIMPSGAPVPPPLPFG